LVGCPNWVNRRWRGWTQMEACWEVGLWGESVGWVSELGEPQMEGMDADGGVLGGVLVGRVL
jgi:hypothetical protein